jgi:hypothetical protein
VGVLNEATLALQLKLLRRQQQAMLLERATEVTEEGGELTEALVTTEVVEGENTEQEESLP